jgi:putative ABC transport system permease protein
VLSEGARHFLDGFLNRQVTVTDTLTIIAVGEHDPSYRINLGAPLLIPEERARRLSSTGVILSGDPAALLAAARSGRLFGSAGQDSRQVYPVAILELDPRASVAAVTDSIEALGFDSFSFAEQFQEIQRFYVYFYLGMGAVGLIALVTAALGILNTMVMSITERFREIGIMKSLGADERDIRLLFLVESAVIGTVGSVVGIAAGWAATRIVSVIMKAIMAREEMVVFEPFATPEWLVGLAFLFGLLISLLAGTWPATRAARVDPVEALRSE